MKSFLLSFGFFALFLSACNIQNSVVPSKEIIEFNIPIDDIDAIEVSGIYKVTIGVGEEEKLVVRCNKNLKEYLDITDKGNTASFQMDNLSVTNDYVLEAKITVKELKYLNCSGAVKIMLKNASFDNIAFQLSGVSNIKSKGLSGNSISIDGSGASHFFAKNINVKSISIENSGASSAEVDGNTETLDANYSGAARLNAEDLTVSEMAKISGSGASHMEITAMGEIAVALSGASKLRYSGNPTSVREAVSGAAKVEAH